MNGLVSYGIMMVILGLVFWSRTRAMVRPIKGSGIKILLPILYLAPVINVFMNLQLQVKILEIGVAALVGVLLAIPLMWTTNYEIRQDGQIYLQKNKTFFIALLAVIVLRIVLRQFFSDIDQASLAMLYFTVAFSYVAVWRIASFVKFRKVKQSQALCAEMSPIQV